MTLDLLYNGTCCRLWSAESRTRNSILMGYIVGLGLQNPELKSFHLMDLLVAEILDVIVWEISNSSNIYSIFFIFIFLIQLNGKKCTFSQETNRNFPPILQNFPPFLNIFLYFRGTNSLQMSKFPGNQVPEFPIFSRHV